MKRKYSKVIREIAKREGVAPDVIYAEMQKGIEFGYNNLDPAIQEYWRKIIPDGEVPTSEKVIEALAIEIKKNK